MAIVYGEYGPYDDATGAPVWNSGGETGTIWMTQGNETVPSTLVGMNSPAMPDSSYITRGNYRMPNQGFGGSRMGGGQLEFLGDTGWKAVDASNAPSGYDYRQDSNTQGSNERLRFDQAFSNAPSDIPITGMQDWAMANGWTEPDRSNNEGTLGALFSNVAPYVGLMMGGIGAMGGFAGAAGAGSGLANTGYIDALGGMTDATGTALSGWANTAGTTMGSGAMDFSNLGDLWDYSGTESLADPNYIDALGGMTDSTGTALPGWVDSTPGLMDKVKSFLSSNPGTTLQTAVKALSGSGKGTDTSMLSALAKLYGAYNSEGNLKDAIGANRGAIDRAVNWQDPNQPRGNEANRLWMENYTNPKAGYNEFMQGAGRDFTEQARAAAAKSGKRGSYLNSGKMQSDLASLWMKNQFSRGDSLAKGFTNPRNYAADALRDSLGLSDLYKQKGGSIGMAVGDLLGSSQARELISNITGSYW